MQHADVKRAGIFSFAVYLAFGVLIFRLWTVSVTNCRPLRDEGVSQRTWVEDMRPERGKILDREGLILAVDTRTYDIHLAEDFYLTNPDLFNRWIQRLEIPPKEVAERFAAGRHVIRRSVPYKTARWMDEAGDFSAQGLMDLPGFQRIERHARSYPQGELARQIIGAVTADDPNQGAWGLELTANEKLSGRRGFALEQAQMLRSGIGFDQGARFAAEAGDDVRLTLNGYIQFVAEKELQQALRDSGARRGTVIVLDLKSMDVLAMANAVADRPGNDITFNEKMRNIAASFVYEPGSTMKLITAALAVDSGLMGIEDTVEVPWTLRRGKFEITDVFHHTSGHMLMSLEEIIIKSSNIGIALVGEDLGTEKLRGNLLNLNFGSPLNLGLYGEDSGSVLPRDNWWPVSDCTVSYGYGVSTTPLQMTTAVAAIVNDGVYRRPRVFMDQPADEGVRVFKSSTSREMRKIMRSVVKDGADKAQLEGYVAGGKTGTARFYDGGYTEKQYVSSFIGFAPYDDPTLMTCVVLDRPQGAYYGGAVAAPVFKRVMDNVLPWLLFGRMEKGAPDTESETLAPDTLMAKANQ